MGKPPSAMSSVASSAPRYVSFVPTPFARRKKDSLLPYAQFAVRSAKFPVPNVRESGRNGLNLFSNARAASPSRPRAPKFPCIFPHNREMRNRDRFADDCLHRQKPAEICENLLGSKIYPRPDCTVGGKKATRTGFGYDGCGPTREAHNPMSGGSSRHCPILAEGMEVRRFRARRSRRSARSASRPADAKLPAPRREPLASAEASAA